MSLEDAFRPLEVAYREQVLTDTWGHLAPKRNKVYRGRVVYAVGCFGSDHLNPTILACELEDLESSPWFYETLSTFVNKQKTEVGFVYEFVGQFKNYVLTGKTRVIYNANGITEA